MKTNKPVVKNRCLALTRAGMMEGLVFRTSMFANIAANAFYLILIYFLWRAIYDSSPTGIVNGMSFYDTMIYLVLASAMFNFMDEFVVWNVGDDYQTGKIVMYLTKPMDYQKYMFWALSGNIVINFLVTFVPTFIVVCIVARGTLAFGWNILFFFLSLVFATALNFMVDFFVGIICFYTQSVWGVNIMKEVVVALLSGATIPLAFFPELLRKVVNVLPFQAIYNTPLQMLADKSLTFLEYGKMFVLQLIWLGIAFVATRIFWSIAKRKLTVNGG